jgi:hypothetical protein
MGSLSIFDILAFVFSVAAYFPYTKAVLSSKAQPTISSWISWLIMDSAILAGMLAQHTIAWQMVAYIIGVGFVIGASLWKRATIGLTRLDSFCLSVVLIAVLLWALSGDPDIAIMLSLVALIVGTIPMIVNVWRNPSREPLLPWILFLAGGVCGVFAIPLWNIAAALTPFVFLILQITIVLLVSRKFQSNEGTV